LAGKVKVWILESGPGPSGLTCQRERETMQVRCDFAILSSLVVLFLLHVVSLYAANALCWLLCFFGMARLTTYSRALRPGCGEREHVCVCTCTWAQQTACG
jgi:hypothetical protein